jgi:hypothetical protein
MHARFPSHQRVTLHRTQNHPVAPQAKQHLIPRLLGIRRSSARTALPPSQALYTTRHTKENRRPWGNVVCLIHSIVTARRRVCACMECIVAQRNPHLHP